MFAWRREEEELCRGVAVLTETFHEPDFAERFLTYRMLHPLFVLISVFSITVVRTLMSIRWNNRNTKQEQKGGEGVKVAEERRV